MRIELVRLPEGRYILRRRFFWVYLVYWWKNWEKGRGCWHAWFPDDLMSYDEAVDELEKMEKAKFACETIREYHV